jgi:hypothetical protein
MSILFGIDQSLEGNHARARAAAPRKRCRSAALDARLMNVKWGALGVEAQHRLVRNCNASKGAAAFAI